MEGERVPVPSGDFLNFITLRATIGFLLPQDHCFLKPGWVSTSDMTQTPKSLKSLKPLPVFLCFPNFDFIWGLSPPQLRVVQTFPV